MSKKHPPAKNDFPYAIRRIDMRFLRAVSLLATMLDLASSAFGQVFDGTPDNDRGAHA